MREKYLYEACERCHKTGILNKYCPHFLECNVERNGVEKERRANTVINKFKDFDEICVYEKPFLVGGNCEINTSVDRSRKFVLENGVLKPKDENTTIEDLQASMFDSAHRAKDKFFGYALCNEWRYFITLTFDPKKVNRGNEEEVKKCWRCFRVCLQRIDTNVKILCAPERHPTSGKLHFHALVGNMALGEGQHIEKAVNPKTGDAIKNKFGNTVYNVLIWRYGFSTLIDLAELGYSQDKVAHYLISYTSKENNDIGYNKRRYYATRNLAFKEKEVALLPDEERAKMLNSLEVVPYKQTDKMTVYRRYHTDLGEKKNE